MKKLAISLIALTLMVAASGPALAEGTPEVYLKMESFAWEEYGQAGERLLKESGVLPGVGFSYHNVLESGMTMRPRVEIFSGTVDYEGATWGGTPVSSDVDYFGFRGEFDIGVQVGDDVIVEPFGGIGIRAWDREINDSITATGTRAIGYKEEWRMTYMRVGLRFISPPDGAVQGHFELGAMVPLHTENTARLSEKFTAGDVTLEPDGKTTLFAEAGFKKGHFKMSAFYEELRFGKSSPEIEPISGFYLYQPRSEADMFGLRLGAAF